MKNDSPVEIILKVLPAILLVLAIGGVIYATQNPEILPWNNKSSGAYYQIAEVNADWVVKVQEATPPPPGPGYVFGVMLASRGDKLVYLAVYLDPFTRDIIIFEMNVTVRDGKATAVSYGRLVEEPLYYFSNLYGCWIQIPHYGLPDAGKLGECVTL